MRKHTTPILCLLLFVVIAATFACTTPPTAVQNTSPPPPVAANEEAEDKARLDSLDCSGDSKARADNARTFLNTGDIGGGPDATELERQRGSQFWFDVEEYETKPGGPKAVLVRMRGTVLGHDDNLKEKGSRLTQLWKFVEAPIKKGCVDRVSFETKSPTPTPGGSPAVTSQRGFEWQACPYPQVPCPYGGCAASSDLCKRKTE